jgi:hypothetical protein
LSLDSSSPIHGLQLLPLSGQASRASCETLVSYVHWAGRYLNRDLGRDEWASPSMSTYRRPLAALATVAAVFLALCWFDDWRYESALAARNAAVCRDWALVDIFSGDPDRNKAGCERSYDAVGREWANANPAQRDALRAQRERTKSTVGEFPREGYLGMLWRRVVAEIPELFTQTNR